MKAEPIAGARKAPAGHEPYIPASQDVAETTARAIVLGCIIAIVVGAANAYLGLKAGQTVSASIPAAAISMGVLRLLGKGTVLENNIVQTIGSSGESLAAGVIFTIPALIFMGPEFAPGIGKIFLISMLGGLLGILFWIPLRRYLIVKEHDVLPFPEGTACAQVLITGDTLGSKWLAVVKGIGVGGAFQAVMTLFSVWRDNALFTVQRLHKMSIGCAIEPALLGVGYIVGPRICSLMFAGGMLGWMVIIPLIDYFGSGLGHLVPPADLLAAAGASPETLLIANLAPEGGRGIWGIYLRYIGAGAVAAGGLISVARALPTITGSFAAVFRDLVGGKVVGGAGTERTDRDLPYRLVIFGSLGTIVALWVMLRLTDWKSLVAVVVIVILGFFFVTVAARICGLVGSSSSPVSGMTITALLVTSLVFVTIGWTGLTGQAAALTVGAVLCIAICMSGDIAQDLKTGYLVGATPSRQQAMEVVALLAGASTIGFTVYYLHRYLVIGSDELPAPQANLMYLVTKGIFEGNLPWSLVIMGMGIGVVVELLGIPSLAFSIGLYLPFGTSTAMFLGGLASWALPRLVAPERLGEANERGVLLSSGLVAGGAIVGIVTVPIVVSYGEALALGPRLGGTLQRIIESNGWAMVAFGSLAVWLFLSIVRGSRRA